MYFSLYLLLLVPVFIFVMRIMAKKDEMIFRLIGLNLIFRFVPKNRGEQAGVWTFGPAKYEKKLKRMRGYDS